MVGAVLHGTAWAQVGGRDTTRAKRPDSTAVGAPVRVDTLLSRPDTTRLDTIRPKPAVADSVPRDTIKAPMARSEVPLLTDVGPAYRWDRAAFFATGALTLLDLLERVPGITGLRAAWIASPQTASYLGDVSRVRVFYDGVELDAIDPAARGIEDLSTIPLWSLEEVAVERGADEVRVHIRSWRVERTTASTRTDVATGSEDTNLYRAFFGRRFDHGEALQVAAQQFSTRSPRLPATSGDQLTIFLRGGIARRGWAVDGALVRETPTREQLASVAATGYVIPSLNATRTVAYLRAANGDPEAGGWVQVLGSSLVFRETPPGAAGSAAPPPAPGAPPPSREIRRSRAEWVTAGGYTTGPLRVSITGRHRVFDSRAEFSPSVRLAWAPGALLVTAFGERSGGADRATLAEASARLAPLSFLAVTGGVTHRSDRSPSGTDRSKESARGEVAVRLGSFWVSGGGIARGPATLVPPVVYDSALRTVDEPSATGSFAALRGPVLGPLSADITGIRWTTEGVYRPLYQFRGELSVSSSWLRRFPSGNFHVFAAALEEYRTSTYVADGAGLRGTGASRVLSTLLEVRIVSATLSWQYRNILGEPYQYVPGYYLPRQLSIYGVRWDFWN